ncbi:MAG: DNA polymerase, partial [Propionibacteriaceae bacterium]
DQRTYRLDDLVIRHLHRELKIEPADVLEETGDQLAFDFSEPKQADIPGPAMLRARAILALGEQLDGELAKLGESAALLTTLEQPLTRTLAQMEATGIAVDTDMLDQLRKDFDSQVTRAADTSFHLIGKEINLSSPKQLQAVLFDDLGMPKTRKTATGYTTDAESLQKLFEQTEHPFLQQLLYHRDAIKLRQTVDGLLAAVRDDGRIHTTYLQTVAGTGRLSSTDPNLQNIPIRTEAGRQIRKAFVVGDGYTNLMSADYSQIEMRIMAHVSQDQGLIEAFASGIDFHKVTASRVFGVPVEDVTAEQRSSVKAMNYGLAYGLSAFGLSSQLGVAVSTAKTMMSDYFDSFGGVRDYLAEVVKKATKTGYTETMFGRRRYLPDLASPNRQRREMAERAALNAPIQGSAADIMKRAMLILERKLREEQLASRMLLQVHDELIVEIAPSEDERIIATVRDAMEHAAELAIPLDVSVGIGPSWFAAAH